jgi:hypothetical protein
MASMEDILKKFPMDEERQQRLYDLQTECAICWETQDHWPVGVMHRYMWHDGKIWATCSGKRHRVPALRRNPKSCVIITGLGTELGPIDTQEELVKNFDTPNRVILELTPHKYITYDGRKLAAAMAAGEE